MSLVKTGIVAVVLLGLSALAQAGCHDTASLVNPNADPGGIGGTGMPAHRTQESMAVKPGLGGTGAAEGGLGGTGIVGVITGFASICVNGLEVHYDAETPVAADGKTASVKALAVGQLVAVQAVGTEDRLSARTISVIHAVVGPVSEVDSRTGRLAVLGQSVLVASDDTALNGLRTGDWVAVSGYRLVSGEVVASRVEPIAPQAQAQMTGQIGRRLDTGFTVQNARVSIGRVSMPSEAIVGAEVSVRGQWDGSTLHAQAMEVEPTVQKVGQVNRVVLEGYVHAVSGNEVTLGSRVLTLSPGFRMSGLTTTGLAVNQRVQLSGHVGRNQHVTVDRVNVRSRAPELGRESKRSDKDEKSDDDSHSGSDDDSSSDSKSGSSGSDDSGKSGSDSSGSAGSSGSDDGGSSGSRSGTSGSGSSDSSGSDSSGSGSSGSSGSSGKGSSGSGSGSSGSSGSGKSGGGRK